MRGIIGRCGNLKIMKILFLHGWQSVPGGAKPTFLSEVEIIDLRTFGKTNDHLKLFVRDSFSSFPFELISFYSAGKKSRLSKGQKIQVVYSVEVDRWGGSEKLRGKINYLARI